MKGDSVNAEQQRPTGRGWEIGEGARKQAHESARDKFIRHLQSAYEISRDMEGNYIDWRGLNCGVMELMERASKSTPRHW